MLKFRIQFQVHLLISIKLKILFNTRSSFTSKIWKKSYRLFDHELKVSTFNLSRHAIRLAKAVKTVT
ncbi:hypothetical protein BpHYR1_007236 [Brachionus plicatilis]|uniref:Uncharacterized protein n=1 Tax=Brachionus plicatilis TaxID=10195 RepID=A0A3M7QZJ0_BRAPC|nr:hypothetical protein BpHYR1_007236 [Brachionus plicatilis]